MAALASHLWQGRARAASSSLQPIPHSRAAASSPKSGGKTVAGNIEDVGSSPRSPVRSPTNPRSPREQLQGIAVSAASIAADIDAAAVSTGNRTEQQRGAALPNAVDSTITETATMAAAEAQQGSGFVQGLSDRELRAAARAGKVSQKAASSSLKGKHTASLGAQGRSSRQSENTDGQVGPLSDPQTIPQTDGAADDDSTDAVTDTTTSVAEPSPPSAAMSGSTALGFHSRPPVPPQPSSSFNSGAAPNGPAGPSALEQMAARYLLASSSARNQVPGSKPASSLPAAPSLQAALAKGLPGRHERCQHLASHQAVNAAATSLFDSIPTQRLGLVVKPAASQHHHASIAVQPTLPSTIVSTEQKQAGRSQQVNYVDSKAALLSEPTSGGQAQGDKLLNGTAARPSEVAPETQIVCPCSGRKHHFGCLPLQQQLQVRFPTSGA